MNHLLRIDGPKFDSLSFFEAVLLFDVVRELPAILDFPVWGASLLTASNWHEGLTPPKLSFDVKLRDVHIAGYSRLRFEGVRGGSVEVFPYEPCNLAGKVRENRKRDILRLERRWEPGTGKRPHAYQFGGRLIWPYGTCELSILADDGVFLEYNSDDCVSVVEYCKNPHKYSWSPTRLPPS